MKINGLLSLAAGVTAMLMLSGCEGPEGPPGKDGTDANLLPFNIDGFAAGIRCASCHTADQDTTYYVAGRKYQWEQSKHAIGGDIERNGSTCAGCHTTEGFVQRMNGGAVTNQYIPSPPGCFACHSPHGRGNFTLRDTTAVIIQSNITGVANATFNYGRGNLCVKCHQTRDMSPKMNANAPGDSLVITTARWYSHYGVQGQMLMGEGGFKFPGYVYNGNSVHTGNTAIQQRGCPICHMAEQAYPPGQGTGKAGGHTMRIRYDAEGGIDTPLLTGCNRTGCHTSPPMSAALMTATQAQVEANLDTLLHLLGSRGWIDTVTTSAGYKSVLLVGGKQVIRPAIKAGAIYNYFFVEHDLSEGIHNTKYANELLRSSIEEMRKP